jgi:O-antigen/teichoic acid export membrane protein
VLRNLAANILGQGWIALLGIVFFPFYISRLGVESYGLIGFYTVLQSWIALLDLGMTPAAVRETARLTPDPASAEAVCDLVRSLQVVTIVLAVLVVLGLWALSGPVAVHWLTPQALPRETVAHTLMIIALAAGGRFCEGIHRGVLFGMHRHLLYNSIYTTLSTVRYAGAALVVMVLPSIEAFFWWQAALSIVIVLALAWATRSVLPRLSRRPRFSLEALRRISRFSGGLSLTGLFAFLFTQIDKVMVSRFVDLESFGVYMLAVALAGMLPMLAAPIVTTFFPSLSATVAAADREQELSLFRSGTQLIAILAAPVIAVFTVMGWRVVLAWTGNPVLASSVAPVLCFIALGTFCNVVLQVPFTLQLAHGWTTLSVRINALGAILLAPAVYLGFSAYGLVGVAAAWALINAVVLILSTVAMHRRLLSGELWRFVRDALVVPLAASFFAVGCVALALQRSPDRIENFGIVVLAGGLALLATSVSLPAGWKLLRLLMARLAGFPRVGVESGK